MSEAAEPLLGDLVNAGVSATDADDLGNGIYCSPGVSNSYMVTAPGGNVIINTGLPFEAERHAAIFAQVSPSPVRAIIFTQSHPDHVGGWDHFNAPGVATIVQESWDLVRGDWARLAPYYQRRARRLWGALMDAAAATSPPEPIPTVRFADEYTFAVGGRSFHLFSTPGGETLDSSIVWLPEDRTAFTGNLMGPIFGHVPNLYTIRGDRIRGAASCIRSVERVRALEPEVLITGHGDPVRGAEEIQRALTKFIDAVRFLHDTTLDGMNAGTDLFALMREIRLPPELALGEGHGKVAWNVRAIWEEYAGWCRMESTTELYAVPPSAIWPELVELAGGADGIAARAAAHAAANEPLLALHLTDMVLAGDPSHDGALRAAFDAHTLLLERAAWTNLSETRWLQSEADALGERLENGEGGKDAG